MYEDSGIEEGDETGVITSQYQVYYDTIVISSIWNDHVH